jgi:hypothetical protein
VLVHDELPLPASAAIDVVVVYEFHNMETIAKIKTNKRKNLPKIKSKSMMDSRFMGLKMVSKSVLSSH